MSKTLPTWLYSGNAWFIEALYEQYLHNPNGIEPEWRDYFDSIQDQSAGDISHTPIRQAYYEAARHRHRTVQSATPATDSISHQKQAAVLRIINAYRFRGHSQADLDPLGQYQRPEVPDLDPAYHGLSDEDMDKPFNTGSMFSPDEIPLREILEIIGKTYCGTIGAEYMHINETEQKRWIQKRLEESRSTPAFDKKKKITILKRLIAANALEEYLHTKYVGQKRFSLEGGESLISLLDELIQDGGSQNIKEAVIGMAHRGRINVLVNIIGKKPSELFDEFEGKTAETATISGDVKYHQGYSSDIRTPGGSIHLTLAFNPSHLEIIDPVVEGSVRARQDRRNDGKRNQVLPVLIHGDAAFAGQGVVMETLNLSQTRGYTTGGTVHIVVNNQIGFTTSDPVDSRSTLYCTDIAKMVQAPIFHVNADDPEAVVYIAKLALDFRMEFKKDVVIDMVCYRRHGHSEADEPSTTQPVMYQKIKNHTGVRAQYTGALIDKGILSKEDANNIKTNYLESLESNKSVAGTHAEHSSPEFLLNYSAYTGTHWTDQADTTINKETIGRLSERITTLPDGFALHPAVNRIIEARRKMGQGELEMDWGYAETMAYASLLDKGHPVRISGQDCGRGTFFHRHAVVHDQNNGDTYLPLQHIKNDQPSFLVINSTLSEEAVLAFDYGYSSASPDTLVIWEAQFGDFANGAQVVFDQFISSCETKWSRLCGLVVFLPHGHDGQGPEHSSARPERYLQLCAEENIQVCYPSTPAQMFHMLQRQVLRPYRKPLIVMTPKSLLRRKISFSTLDDLAHGHFYNVIDEIDDLDKNKITRLLICSGKVYFDLLEQRREHKINHIAIARIEQLFPFPTTHIRALLKSYPNLKEVIWAQEEPKNQGSWYYMLSNRTMMGCLKPQHTFRYAGRMYSASPATGHFSLHQKQQKQLVAEALQLDKQEVQAQEKSA